MSLIFNPSAGNEPDYYVRDSDGTGLGTLTWSTGANAGWFWVPDIIEDAETPQLRVADLEEELKSVFAKCEKLIASGATPLAQTPPHPILVANLLHLAYGDTMSLNATSLGTAEQRAALTLWMQQTMRVWVVEQSGTYVRGGTTICRWFEESTAREYLRQMLAGVGTVKEMSLSEYLELCRA